jgi:prepilin-type N-terminal cleavage/methylation domain-containing protein
VSALRPGAAPARAARSGRAEVREAGFTLVEVSFAATIIAIVLTGLLGTMILSYRQSLLAADLSIAADAARRQAEVMASQRFRDIFFLYNATDEDDPNGRGTGFGSGFEVQGLDPRAADGDGRVGRVVFPTRQGFPRNLVETAVIPELGMPRDLDGSGAIEGSNKEASYVLLPVTLKLEWRGVYGDASYTLHVLLADRAGGG